PISGTSDGASRYAANAGTFWNVTEVTFIPLTSAEMRIRPAGASTQNSVTGSVIGTMPVSSSTVATQMVLLPDMTGYSVCSMMTNPAAAEGSEGWTSRLQHRPGYPRGSRSMSLRRSSA